MSPTSPNAHDDPAHARTPRAGVFPADGWGTSRLARLVAGGILVTYSLVMALLVPVPYILIQPGSADNVMPLIAVEGPATYVPEGELLFLTVSLSQRITPARAVQARFVEDEVEIVEERRFTGGQSREEVRQINLELMNQSKDTAVKVALERLGFPVEVGSKGALVTEVQAGRPADGRLLPGDVIVAIDGKPVEVAQDAIDLVQAHAPGDSVAVVVDREGGRADEVVTTVEGDEGQALIGIGLADNLEVDFPFDVDIDTGRVGGPSAGLAFALAVIDQLTPGELTGGKVVAVTGAIDTDGNVVEVGGVTQKAVAARHAGAVLMLVPAGEEVEAKRTAGDMLVVGVATLDDALDALARVGGNAQQALPAAQQAP